MCCDVNRVMTVSFHKYGDFFFPGTGDVKDIGEVRLASTVIWIPFQASPGLILSQLRFALILSLVWPSFGRHLAVIWLDATVIRIPL